MDLPWRKVEIWRCQKIRMFQNLHFIMTSEGESTYFKWHADQFLVIFGVGFATPCLLTWQEAEGRANVMFSDLVDTNCGPCGIWRVSPKKAQPLHRNEPSPTKLMFSVEHHPRNGTPKIPNNPKHNLTQTLSHRIHWVNFYLVFVCFRPWLRRKKAKSDTEEGVPANETYEAPAESCVEGYRSWQSNIALRKCGSRY